MTKAWVPFDGESMTPALKAGDSILVDGSRTGPLREGDVVVTGPFRLDGRRVWSAHRVHRRGGRLATKGDRATDWDPPAEVVGMVLGCRRGNWEIVWGERGQAFKKAVALISRRMKAGPKGKPWRLLLRFIAALEWAVQLGLGHVRYHSV